MSDLLLACPTCRKSIKTATPLALLPATIKCPSCNHTAMKEHFAAPVPVPATTKPVKQPSLFEKVVNIECQSTITYATFLWVMSIVAAIGIDALAILYILITGGTSIGAPIGAVLGVHLIGLPLIRVALELAINVERLTRKPN